MAFDPGELRDPHGKWTKAGGIEKAFQDAAKKIAGVQKGKRIGLHGHTIDNIPSKGIRVRLRGKGSQHYAHPEDAARAVIAGEHVTPQKAGARETAVREVVSPKAPPAGSKTYQSQAETMQAITTGLDVPPTRSWEIIGQAMDHGTQSFEHPKGHATLTFHSNGHFTLEDKGRPDTSQPRTITAKALKPGMVVSTKHWQGKRMGQHEIAKLEGSGAASRSGGVIHGSGIYDTASTHVTTASGDHYQVSNNTKFTVHKEAPPSDIPSGAYMRPSSGGLIKAFKPSGAASFFDNETEARKWLRGDPTAKHHESGSVYLPGQGVTGGSGRRRGGSELDRVRRLSDAEVRRRERLLGGSSSAPPESQQMKNLKNWLLSGKGKR